MQYFDLFDFPVKSNRFIEGIWKASAPLRAIDPLEARNYVLSLFFLKYISDLEASKPASSKRAAHLRREQIASVSSGKPFYLPPGCDFDTLYERRNEPYLGEIINSILKAIEETNQPKLSGVFSHLDFNSEAMPGPVKERDALLRRFIEGLADEGLNLHSLLEKDQEILRDTFEGLLYRFAGDCGKNGNEFYTPAEVSLLLAKLLQPQRGDRICDPTCGSGSLLLRLAKEVPGEDCSLFGQEVNRATWAICKMNMLIHGKEDARIEWGNTLTQPKLIEGRQLMRFDIVAATLPFIQDKWVPNLVSNDQFNRFHRGVPTSNRIEFAFITHMIESVDEKKGRVGVVMPHGALFRGGKEKQIRQALVEQNLLDAVVGLPSHLFFGTPIPVVILIFDRSRTSDEVMFVNASADKIEGKDLSGKKLSRLDINRLDKIVDFVIKKNVQPHLSQRVPLKQIVENDFDLSIARYIDTSVKIEDVDPRTFLTDLHTKLEKELAEVSQELEEWMAALLWPMRNNDE